MDRMETRPAWVINLCFHGVGAPQRDLEPGESSYWITNDLFLRVIDLAVGREDVRLSFDDGNHSDVAIGLPALVERGLRADFFVLAGRLDSPGSLRADDVRALRDHGMGIGSHGLHHVDWRSAPPATLRDEVESSRDILAEVIGQRVDTAACPFGEYDRDALGALRRAGYRRVMTSDRALASERSWLQPRFSVHATDTVHSVRALIGQRPSVLSHASYRARSLVKSLR